MLQAFERWLKCIDVFPAHHHIDQVGDPLPFKQPSDATLELGAHYTYRYSSLLKSDKGRHRPNREGSQLSQHLVRALNEESCVSPVLRLVRTTGELSVRLWESDTPNRIDGAIRLLLVPHRR